MFTSPPSYPHCRLSPCILLDFDHYNCSDVLWNSLQMFALSNLLHCPAGGNNFFLLFAQGDWSACLVHREPSTLDQFDDSQKGNIASFPGFMSCSWSLIKIHHWVALSDNNKPTDWGKRKFFCLQKLTFSRWINTITWLELQVLSAFIKSDRKATSFAGTFLSLFLCYLTTSRLSVRNSASFPLLYSGGTVRNLIITGGRGLILEKVELNDQIFWIHVHWGQPGSDLGRQMLACSLFRCQLLKFF